MSYRARDIGLVCLNGHDVNNRSTTEPQYNADYCPKCGAKTISECPHCSEPINGEYLDPNISAGRPALFCHACGKPYPWTEKKAEALEEMIAELVGFEAGELEKLKESIPDLICETPKSDIAVFRYRNAIIKAGTIGGKALYDLAASVAGSVIANKLTG